jgi:hypothetical protein
MKSIVLEIRGFINFGCAYSIIESTVNGGNIERIPVRIDLMRRILTEKQLTKKDKAKALEIMHKEIEKYQKKKLSELTCAMVKN